MLCVSFLRLEGNFVHIHQDETHEPAKIGQREFNKGLNNYTGVSPVIMR